MLSFGTPHNQMIKPEIKTQQKSASHNNLVQLPSSSSFGGFSGPKVVAERTICYCSNFDLSLGEWVTMHENMESFSENLRHELGK